MKSKVSDSGTKNTHLSLEGDTKRIFIHLVPPKAKYVGQPTLIFAYCESDGEDGWTHLINPLGLYEGETNNFTSLKFWMESQQLNAHVRNAWSTYVNLRDGRI